jgi:aspartokinase
LTFLDPCARLAAHCPPENESGRSLGEQLSSSILAALRERGACAQAVSAAELLVTDDQNGIVSHAFAALGNHGTRVIAVAQAATEYSVSFCIPEEQAGDTVRFLHRELGLERGRTP